jgi:conjugal transfer pilin signal peptidase TrbI
MKGNRFWLKMIIGMGVYLLLLFSVDLLCHDLKYGIKINRSESLPFTVFFSSKGCSEVQRDSYVFFQHPDMTKPLAKKVAGVAGDSIVLSLGHVLINGKSYGEVLSHSKSGTKLTPISKGVIPEGFVFMSSFHPDSFDSRYQEFGLISVDAVKGELWPLF